MDWLLELLSNIGFFFEEAEDWFFSKEIDQILRIFWVFFFLEIPRYFFTDIYVLVHALRHGALPGRHRQYDANKQPRVSVIMAALNEELIIGETLRTLLAQGYPDLEIIVVDDGSTDATPDICQEFAAQGQIRYFRFDERAGKSAALNYGIQVASGELFMFIDTDTTFDRLAILNIVQCFRDPRVGAAGGNFRIRNYDINVLTRFVALEYFLSMSMGWRFKGLMGIINCVPGWFGVYRRELVKSIGLFEPGPGNDSDLTIRLRKSHQTIVFVSDAISLTDAPIRWRDWIRQRMRWSRNLVKNRLRRHKDVFDIESANFSPINLWAFLDNIFFLMVMPFAWVLYFIDMIFHYPDELLIIIFVALCLHLLLRCLQFAIAVFLSERKKEPLELLPYLFFYGLYMMFYKVVRVIAYIQELFFRASYDDPFAPPKVRKKMIRY